MAGAPAIGSKWRERVAQDLKAAFVRAAYADEVKTGKAPRVIAPATLEDVVTMTGMVRNDNEVADVIARVESAEDPLEQLREVLHGVSGPGLNYLLAQYSYRYYCTRYFKHMMWRSFSSYFHDSYFQTLRGIETHTIRRPVVVCGPRSWGKTAIGTTIMPSHAIIFPVMHYMPDGTERDISKSFMIFVSAVAGNAQRFMGSLCIEIEENDSIRRDFGEFYRDPDQRGKDRNKPWSKLVAITLNKKRMEALGRRGKVRSTFWCGNRINLAIIDDVEDDDNLQSKAIRDRDFRWLTSVVLPAVCTETGNVLVLGNRTHSDGLVARLFEHGEKAGWVLHDYTISRVNPETGQKEYNWPEHFGEEFERQARLDLTDEGYDQEYEQKPDAFLRELKKESFQHYDAPRVMDALPSMEVYCAMDPAASVSRRSDSTAIVPVAYSPRDNMIYVLPAFEGKPPISEQASVAVSVYCQFTPMVYGIEATAYQAALQDLIRAEAAKDGLNIPMLPLPSPGNKFTRIAMRLFSRIRSGQIRFLEHDAVHCKLIQQLMDLAADKATHDDLCDALEMAVRLIDMNRSGKLARLIARGAYRSTGGRVYARVVSVGRGTKESGNGKERNPRILEAQRKD